MEDEAFDELVDDATHAVFNLIPDEKVNAMSKDDRSVMLFRINDALTPILRDAVGEA